MSTSGIYSFSVSRDDIIRQAMLNIRRLDPYETPTAQETQDCARMLNMMCKQWMGKSDFAPGLKVWTRKRGHLLLSPSTGQYTLSNPAQGWTNALTQTTSTAYANTGANTLAVTSAAGFVVGGTLAVAVDSEYLFYTTVSSVSGLNVGLAAPLTAPVVACDGAVSTSLSTSRFT